MFRERTAIVLGVYYSALGPVGRLFYNGLLIIGGLIALAALIVGIARAEDVQPLIGVGIAIAGFSVVAALLAVWLPARASHAAKRVAIAGFTAIYVLLLVCCLFAPGDVLVPAGSQGPGTVSAMRSIGVVMAVLGVVVAVVVSVNRRVRRRNSIVPPVR